MLSPHSPFTNLVPSSTTIESQPRDLAKAWLTAPRTESDTIAWNQRECAMPELSIHDGTYCRNNEPER